MNGGAKIPSLLVTSPRGIAKQRKEGEKAAVGEGEEESHWDILKTALSKGQKRLQYREVESEATSTRT